MKSGECVSARAIKNEVLGRFPHESPPFFRKVFFHFFCIYMKVMEILTQVNKLVSMTPGVTSATSSGLRMKGARGRAATRNLRKCESTTQNDYVAIGLDETLVS